jgi:hypothetical protein
MSVKKVSIGDTVLIDLTKTTLQASEAPADTRFYDSTGALVTGLKPILTPEEIEINPTTAD